MTYFHCLLIAVVAVASTVHAHHSPAAFDRSAAISIRGEVTGYEWKNPHVYIFVEGTDAAGRAGEWLVEGDPTPLMTRSGWTATTLVPGDAVSLRMFPDRDSSKLHGLLQTLTTPAGVTLGMRTGSPVQRVVASDISGLWDGLPNFIPPRVDLPRNPEPGYTQAAIEARAEYTQEQYPPAHCVAFATPTLVQLPYLYQIEILEDRVLMRSEFYTVERTIYTDGREHPTEGPRTLQGHSIGHWEGTTLVVDTRLFADSRLAHGPGVPSGEQKHTIERFVLSDDGTELAVEVYVEDPEYFSGSYTDTSTWAYAPERQFEPFGCDPENATFYMIE